MVMMMRMTYVHNIRRTMMDGRGPMIVKAWNVSSWRVKRMKYVPGSKDAQRGTGNKQNEVRAALTPHTRGRGSIRHRA